MINRDNTEIRNHAHLMDAEGLEDSQPTEVEIAQFLRDEGWEATNIDIGFDNIMGMWSWSCDIDFI